MGGGDSGSNDDGGSALNYIVSGTMAGFVQVAVGEALRVSLKKNSDAAC